MSNGRLLNLDHNAKTVKGQKRGYKTAILYLAPTTLSGYQVCPMATAGCTAACLNTAGQGVFANVQKARITKTKFFFTHREEFMTQLVCELTKFVAKTRKEGFEPVVRLNGTSDILWEHIRAFKAWPNVMAFFPDVQFYDYTKHIPSKRQDKPANYHLTYSVSDDPASHARALQALHHGWNVAVVFRKVLPETFLGHPVVNGDQDDLRFLDAQGVIVGLKAKGSAKHDTTGFVQE
jgi:hypothetical protein